MGRHRVYGLEYRQKKINILHMTRSITLESLGADVRASYRLSGASSMVEGTVITSIVLQIGPPTKEVVMMLLALSCRSRTVVILLVLSSRQGYMAVMSPILSNLQAECTLAHYRR